MRWFGWRTRTDPEYQKDKTDINQIFLEYLQIWCLLKTITEQLGSQISQPSRPIQSLLISCILKRPLSSSKRASTLWIYFHSTQISKISQCFTPDILVLWLISPRFNSTLGAALPPRNISITNCNSHISLLVSRLTPLSLLILFLFIFPSQFLSV